jgi:hypothetical protein
MNGNLVATRLGAVALLVVLIAMATIPQPAHALTSGNQGLQYGAVIDDTGNILFTDIVPTECLLVFLAR